MRYGRAPDGFGGKKTAYADKVTFRVIPETGAQVAALEAGEVDILELLPVPAARRLESNPDIKIYENMPWAFNVFIFNTNVAPTNNVKFREAVQVALNMEEILAISTEGLYDLNHGWQYPGTTYDAGDIGKEWYNLARYRPCQGAAEGGRLQRRGIRPADRQQHRRAQQDGGGDRRAAEGHRHQRR